MLTGILASKRPPPPATGITLVGTKMFGTGSALAALNFDFTGLTGGIDTAPSVGDYFMVIACNSGWTNAPVFDTDPVGTLATRISIYSNDTIDSGLKIIDGIYEAGSSSGGTIGAESNINSKGYVIVVLRNVDATTPMDVAPVPTQGTNGSNPNPGAITPVSAGAWIFAVGMAGHNDFPQTISIGNMTLLRDLSVNSGTYDLNQGVANKTDWVSGAFDPDTFICTAPASSAHSWAAATLAIRPA
jgi:hypothetical protein